MEHVDTPVPALVAQPAAGDGLFVPAAAARPDRPIPAPFVGLRWRFVPEPARPGRPHAKP